MPAEEEDDFDSLLSSVGFGPWQVPAVLAVALVAQQLAIHLVGSPLLSPPLDFRCFHLDDVTPIIENGSAYYNNECLTPLKNSTSLINPNASMLESPYGNPRYLTSMASCPVIEYDTSIFTASVISYWHLQCERENLQPLYQMLYNSGGMFGSPIGGYVGDKWGRRRALQIGSILYITVVLGTALTSSFPAMLLARVMTGVATQGMLIPVWSHALESTPTRNRSLVGMLLGFPYSVFVVIFSGVGFLLRSWRTLMLVCCCPGLLLLPLAFLMDESPRWLVQQGRQDEAKTVIRRAVRWNKSNLPLPLDSIMEKLDQSAKNPTEDASFSFREVLQKTWAYLRSPAMRPIIFVTPLLWFLQSCLYLSVAINANNFNSSNPFLYVCLSGVMDGSAILLMTPLTHFLGRRVIIGVGLFAGGIFFLLDLAVSSDLFWLKLIMVMVGFFLVAGSFQMNWVYGPELFPTEARSRGFAFVELMGGLGFMCAPMFTYNLATITWWAAPVTFGAAAIIGSFTLPLLPETKNKPMPETLKDVEDRRIKCKIQTEQAIASDTTM